MSPEIDFEPSKYHIGKALTFLREEVKTVKLSFANQSAEYREELVQNSLVQWKTEQVKYNKQRNKQKRKNKFLPPKIIDD